MVRVGQAARTMAPKRENLVARLTLGPADTALLPRKQVLSPEVAHRKCLLPRPQPPTSQDTELVQASDTRGLPSLNLCLSLPYCEISQPRVLAGEAQLKSASCRHMFYQ